MKSIKLLVMLLVLGLFLGLMGCSSDSGKANKKPLDNPLVKLDLFEDRTEGLVFTSKDDKDTSTTDVLDIDFSFNFFNIPDKVDVSVKLSLDGTAIDGFPKNLAQESTTEKGRQLQATGLKIPTGFHDLKLSATFKMPKSGFLGLIAWATEEEEKEVTLEKVFSIQYVNDVLYCKIVAPEVDTDKLLTRDNDTKKDLEGLQVKVEVECVGVEPGNDVTLTVKSNSKEYKGTLAFKEKKDKKDINSVSFADVKLEQGENILQVKTETNDKKSVSSMGKLLVDIGQCNVNMTPNKDKYLAEDDKDNKTAGMQIDFTIYTSCVEDSAVSFKINDKVEKTATVDGNGTALLKNITLPEGEITLAVVVESPDKKKSGTIAEKTVLVDSVPPTVTVTYPADKQTLVDFKVEGKTTGVEKSDNITLIVNEGKTDQIIKSKPAQFQQNSNFAFLFVTLKKGTHTLVVEVQDTSGNKTRSSEVTFTLTDIKPSLTFDFPKAGTPILKKDGTVTQKGFEITVKMKSINVEAAQTGTLKVNKTTDYPFTVPADGNIEITNVVTTEGDNFFQAEVANQAGIKAKVDEFKVLVDSKPPVLEITYPTEDPTYVNTLAITVTGNVDEFAKVKIEGKDIQTDASGNFSKQVPLIAGQSNQIDIEATDTAGNITTITKTVYVDSEAPELAVTAPPSAGARTQLTKFIVHGSTTDRSATISISGDIVTTVNNIVPDAQLQFSQEIDIKPGDGAKNIAITATDKAGNQKTINRIITIDTTGPVVKITSLQYSTINGKNISNQQEHTISGTLNEEVNTLELWINNQKQIQTATTSGIAPNINFSFPDKISLEKYATNTIQVKAVDLIGNSNEVNSENNIEVIYKPADAKFNIDSPTPGSYFKDRIKVLVKGTVATNLTKITVYGDIDNPGQQVPITGTADPYSWELEVDLTTGDGEKTITVKYDDDVNQDEANIKVTLDTKEPTVTMNFSAITITPVATNQGVVKVSGTVDEKTSALTLNGNAATSTYNETTKKYDYTYQLALSGDDGEKTVTVKAVDMAGNEKEISDTLLLDKGDPELILTKIFKKTSPTTTKDITATKITNKEDIILEGTVDDKISDTLSGSGVASIRVKLGNNVYANTDTYDSNAKTWSHNLKLVAGNNIIYIEAKDKVGNITVVTLTIIYDIDVPVVTISSPDTSKDYLTNQSQLVIVGNIQNFKTGTKLYVNVNGADKTADVSSNGNFKTTQTLTSETRQEIIVSAETPAGNTGEKSFWVIFDKTAPEISDVIIAATTDTTPAPLVGKVNDDQATVTIINIDKQNETTVIAPAQLTADGPKFKFNIDIALKEGSNQLKISAIDKAGNQSTQVTKIISLDTGSPIVKITKPTQAEITTEYGYITKQNQVTIEGKIYKTVQGNEVEDEDQTITILIKGLAADKDGATFSKTITGLDEGKNTILIQVIKGTKITTPTVVVTVDTSAPTITIDDSLKASFSNVTSNITIFGTVNSNDTGTPRTVTINVSDGTNSQDYPGSIVGNTYSGLVNLVKENGDNTIKVTITDQAGNKGEATTTITHDNIGPTIKFVNPDESGGKDFFYGIVDDTNHKDGDNYSLNFTVQATDVEVGQEIVLIVNKTSTRKYTQTIVKDISLYIFKDVVVDKGEKVTNIIDISVNDVSGNSSSTYINAVVDTNAPVIYFLNPDSDTQWSKNNDSNITKEGFQANILINTMNLSEGELYLCSTNGGESNTFCSGLDGNGITYKSLGKAALATNRASFNGIDMNQGKHVVIAIATDGINLVNTRNNTREGTKPSLTIEIDSIVPQVTSIVCNSEDTAPTNQLSKAEDEDSNVANLQANFTVTMSNSDDSGRQVTLISTNGGTLGKAVIDGNTATFNAANTPANQITMTEGGHKVTAEVIDSFGNKNEDTASFNTTVDITAPTISIIRPTANQKFTTVSTPGDLDSNTAGYQIALELTADTDANGNAVTVEREGGTDGIQEGSPVLTNGTVTATASLTEEGNQNLRTKVSDAAGNEGVSAWVPVHLDTIVPIINSFTLTSTSGTDADPNTGGFQANLNLTYSNVEDNQPITLTSDQDGVLTHTGKTENDGATEITVTLSKPGDHIITASMKDINENPVVVKTVTLNNSLTTSISLSNLPSTGIISDTTYYLYNKNCIGGDCTDKGSGNFEITFKVNTVGAPDGSDIKLMKDGQQAATSTVTGDKGEFKLTLSAGTNQIQAFVTVSGSDYATDVKNISVDLTEPVVKFTSPNQETKLIYNYAAKENSSQDFADLNDSLDDLQQNFTINVTDANGGKAYLYNGSTLISGAVDITTDPADITFTIFEAGKLTQGGSHLVKAKVYDSNNNLAESLAITVNVDVKPPDAVTPIICRSRTFNGKDSNGNDLNLADDSSCTTICANASASCDDRKVHLSLKWTAPSDDGDSTGSYKVGGYKVAYLETATACDQVNIDDTGVVDVTWAGTIVDPGQDQYFKITDGITLKTGDDAEKHYCVFVQPYDDYENTPSQIDGQMKNTNLYESTIPYDGNTLYVTKGITGGIDIDKIQVSGKYYNDFLFGSYQYNNNSGAIYLLSGKENPNNITYKRIVGETTTMFGNTVGVGNLNGADNPDVAVGAFFKNSKAGHVYIVDGSTLAAAANDSVISSLDKYNISFNNTKYCGYSLDVGASVSGGTRDDLAVGCYSSTVNDISSTGQVFLFTGDDITGDLTENDADLIINGKYSKQLLSYSIKMGKIDSDDHSDLLIGAKTKPAQNENEADRIGTVYYIASSKVASVIGTADKEFDIEDSKVIQINNPGTYEGFGYHINFIGDVNKDGREDFCVGAIYGKGATYIYLTDTVNYNETGISPTNPQPSISLEIDNTQTFGYCSQIGDLNNDGHIDLAVGEEDAVYVYLGKEKTIDTTPAFKYTNLQSAKRVPPFYLGDINGDNQDDFGFTISDKGLIKLIY